MRINLVVFEILKERFVYLCVGCHYMDPEVEIFQHAYWLQNCDRLKFCADILIEKLMLIKDEKPKSGNILEHHYKIRALLETNLLLLGFATENLLKGYLIYIFLKTEKIPHNSGLSFLETKVWGTTKTHDLVILARNTNVKFTDSEIDLLEKLTKYTTWKGRYHIPKHSSDILKHTQPGVGDRHTSEDTRIVEELIIRINQEIKR